MAQLYTVNSQKTNTRSVPGGGFTKVVTVYFTAHPSEQNGEVDVPLEGYGPASVADAVTPMATALNAVQAS